MAPPNSHQDELFEEAIAVHGPALARLARAYERDADRQRDLLQEVHLALWRSLAGFAGACSLRTWVYRVAHNVGASHVHQQRRHRAAALVSLDEVESHLPAVDGDANADRSRTKARIYELIHRLKVMDRQIILLYLEGADAAAIADVTGISPGNAATRIHRIKRLLTERYHSGS